MALDEYNGSQCLDHETGKKVASRRRLPAAECVVVVSGTAGFVAPCARRTAPLHALARGPVFGARAQLNGLAHSTGVHSSTTSAPKIVSYAASNFDCSYKGVPEFNIDHISDCFPDFTHIYV